MPEGHILRCHNVLPFNYVRIFWKLILYYKVEDQKKSGKSHGCVRNTHAIWGVVGWGVESLTFPTTKNETQSVIGFFEFCWQHILHLGILKLLIHLVGSKAVSFDWAQKRKVLCSNSGCGSKSADI